MKKVFTNSADVIHLFANRIQNEARCSNVFFEGDKIYSYGYHYLLGEFIDPATIVINDEGYSSTTAKHISQLSQATSHKVRFYTSEADLSTVLQAIKANAKSLTNARKPELYIEPSMRLWQRLNYFIDYTGRKEMRKDADFKEIASLIDAIEADPKNAADVIAKNAKLRRAREKRQRNARLKKERKEFYAYKRSMLGLYDNKDYLRVSKDGQCIETSQGVRVSLEEARRILRLVDSGRAIGETVNGSFTITACNGVLKVGCHTIERSEIDRVRPILERAQ